MKTPTSRQRSLVLLIVSGSLLVGCASNRTPQFSYDDTVPSLPPLSKLTADNDMLKPLHKPPVWKVAHGGNKADSATGRIDNANAAARIEPRREGYYNAIQIYPWSEGALYQVYAAPGQITNIALEPGESLTGTGPIAAGDTARWIIGDTMSGAGNSARVHILVKPTRPDIATNLVVTTDRRSYMLELRASETSYMASVAWAYPQTAKAKSKLPATPTIPAVSARHYRYAIEGQRPPWRPVSVFDDGRHVYVVFPRGIIQGEMPPLFVLGAAGEPEITNSRVYQNILIVDRLFGAAELRLGSGKTQQTVRIRRTNAPQSPAPKLEGSQGGIRHDKQ